VNLSKSTGLQFKPVQAKDAIFFTQQLEIIINQSAKTDKKRLTRQHEMDMQQ